MKKATLASLILIMAILLPACSAPVAEVRNRVSQALHQASELLAPEAPSEVEPADIQPQEPAPTATPGAPVVSLPPESAGWMAAYEGALTSIYDTVNPSIVNIRTLQQAPTGFNLPEQGIPGLPFEFGPFGDQPNIPSDPQQMPYAQGQASGFVWDKTGHIVTNNHVIAGAEKIEVTFADGAAVLAELVGADPDSDLAVIKVDVPADQLQPVQLANSSQVKVGEIAIAIGNPFGLEGSMTVGIISAIGRTTPASESLDGGPTYSIPDVIQTDAPINPGNSGGVLVDDKGQVIGVTYMIESPSQASAGIGFVIPASIVGRVVPTLIANGSYQHPYLGISGSSLTPAVAEAMDLEPSQRGVLVGDLTPEGPADKAGLRASDSEAQVDGIQIPVGGDVITAIAGTPVDGMDELISYLANQTSVGDKVTLSVLRDGKETSVEVTLEARPARQVSEAPSVQPPQAGARPYMGITAGGLTPAIAEAMDLPSEQAGVLVEQVDTGSPADEAGLRGSEKAATIDGQPVVIGGDVIVAIDGEQIGSMEDLGAILQDHKPGDEITLTVLRDGKEIELTLTLGERPFGP